MALASVVRHRDIDGLRHVRVVDHTGDNSYPTGGWAFTPAQIGFATNVVLLEGSVAFTGSVMIVPDLPNKKLKAFNLNAGAWQEVPNASAILNGVVMRVTYKATGSPG